MLLRSFLGDIGFKVGTAAGPPNPRTGLTALARGGLLNKGAAVEAPTV